MTFAAQFAGRCAAPACSKPITPGDPVVYVDDDLVHDGCALSTDMTISINRAVCDECFTEVSVNGGCLCR